MTETLGAVDGKTRKQMLSVQCNPKKVAEAMEFLRKHNLQVSREERDPRQGRVHTNVDESEKELLLNLIADDIAHKRDRLLRIL